MNAPETVKHLQMLHDAANGIDGKLVLASFGEGLPPVIKHFQVGDAESMANAAISLAQQKNRNIYAPLAVMRPDIPSGLKGNEKDVVAVLGYVADFDKGTGVNYPERCPIKPSYVLETSPNNAQCFFILEEPLLIRSDADRARAKELATRFTKSFDGADPVGVDLSHVWRIPELMNWPNAKKLREGRDPNPFNVRVLQPFSKTVELANLEVLKPIPATTTEVKQSTVTLEYKKKIDLSSLIADGNDSLANLIENGAPEGERSEAVASIVWSLLSKGHGTGDIAALIAAHTKGIGERYNGDLGRIEADVLRLSQKKDDSAPVEVKKPYSLQHFQPIDERSLPSRCWILGHQMLKGKVTVLIAPAGVGKSTVSLTWGLSIATNRNLFDLPVYEAGAVGIINNEDDMDEMNRRLAALQKFHKISNSDLAGRFFLQSGGVQQFMIAKRNKDKAIYPYHKDDLIAFCKANKIKALFVDPFLETHEADENDNRQINEVARMYREVAQQADCAVCIIHHTRKQQGQSSAGHAGNADSGRGASSLIGVARIVSTLYDMSDSDAKQYGIADEDRHLYLRLDDAKANLSLKSNQALWYRRESVLLANGDSVGVLRVAYNLYNALAVSKSTQGELLLSKVKSHKAFESLRKTGKMKREAFMSAMIESGAYLGAATDTRSTLQKRIESHLLGKGITDEAINVSMRKIGSHYTVFYKAAVLPSDASNEAAEPSDSDNPQFLPEVAENFRPNLHKGAENHVASSPPL